jgi:Site-specific recombinase XerC
MSINLYKRKDGRYEARISFGKDSDGKRKYRSVYGKTPEEVKSKMSALDKHEYSITEMTVKEITLEYLDTVKPQLKESTLANYRMKAEKHIIPAFGDKCCCLLTADDVYAFIRKKRKIGMSARYIADIVVLLKGIYRFAARTHNIRNPLDSFKMPKTAKTDVAVLSEHDQHRLVSLATAENDIKHFGAVLSLFTGMRIGELCALKWGDIDLDSKTIHVRRTLQRIQTGNSAKRTKIVITEPKSASSVRDIPIPDCLLPLLEQHRSADDMYVLSGKRKPMECRTLQYRFATLLKNGKLPSVHFHSLRHAFATNCIALGFDVKALSEILGHSTVEITLNRYVHPSIDRKREFMSRLSLVA